MDDQPIDGTLQDLVFEMNVELQHLLGIRVKGNQSLVSCKCSPSTFDYIFLSVSAHDRQWSNLEHKDLARFCRTFCSYFTSKYW